MGVVRGIYGNMTPAQVRAATAAATDSNVYDDAAKNSLSFLSIGGRQSVITLGSSYTYYDFDTNDIDGIVNKTLTEEESKVAVYDIIACLEMTPVDEFIYRDTYLGPSGYQLIMESHVAFDYIEDYLCIDVFSCKDFDVKKATDMIVEKFGFNEYKKNLIDRSFHPTSGQASVN